MNDPCSLVSPHDARFGTRICPPRVRDQRHGELHSPVHVAFDLGQCDLPYGSL